MYCYCFKGLIKSSGNLGLDLIGRLIYLQYCVSCTSSVAGSRLCLRLARVDISSLAHVQASTQHTAAEGN